MVKGSVLVLTQCGQHSFSALIAKSYSDLAHGLVGFPSIGSDRAMVLDFGHRTVVTITMHNVLFPIDIVFVNDAGRVALCTIGLPNDPPTQPMTARRVVEFRSGTVRRLGIDSSSRIAVTEIE